MSITTDKKHYLCGHGNSFIPHPFPIQCAELTYLITKMKNTTVCDVLAVCLV